MSDAARRGIVLVANPRSTRFRPETLAAVGRAFAAHGPVETVHAASLEHTREAARRARERGAGVVAVAGGDGTVAEVAALLAGSLTGLLPIPAGSTNVFARGLGWPARALDVPALVGPALAAPRRRLTLGSIALDDQPARTFCVNAGVGVDAATVDWIEAHPEAKHRFKQLAFAAAAAGPGLRAFLDRAGLEVSVDGTPGVRAATFMAACGRPYAFVGNRPLDFLPRAGWAGYLEWLAMARALPVTGAAHAVRVVMQRGHEAGRAILGGMTDGRIEVTAARPVAVQADGEALGRATTVLLTPGPQLEVVVPAA